MTSTSQVTDVESTTEATTREQGGNPERGSVIAAVTCTHTSEPMPQLMLQVPLAYVTRLEAQIAALQAELKHTVNQHQAETLRADTLHQSELERKDDQHRTELERRDKEHQAYVEKMEQECVELKSSIRLNRYVWDSFSRQNKEFESMLYPFLDPETRRIKFPLVTFPSCACGAQVQCRHMN